MVLTTCVFINLYAQHPALELNVRTSHKKLNGPDALKWSSEGTAKNREAFCSDVPFDSVVAEIALTAEMVERGYNWKSERLITVAIEQWIRNTT